MIVLRVKSFYFTALYGLASLCPHKVDALSTKHLLNPNDLTFRKDSNQTVLNTLLESFVRHKASAGPLLILGSGLNDRHLHLALV